MINKTPRDDAALEAVRQVVRPGTTSSLKQTICACLLIIAARRRRAVSVVAISVAVATVHYWHVLASLLGHLVRLRRSANKRLGCAWQIGQGDKLWLRDETPST